MFVKNNEEILRVLLMRLVMTHRNVRRIDDFFRGLTDKVPSQFPYAVELTL